jgi:hypothetical protein
MSVCLLKCTKPSWMDELIRILAVSGIRVRLGFDFYIIPLAMTLKDCGVFDISSDEYLNFAQNNRKEWDRRGQDVVDQMKKEDSN